MTRILIFTLSVIVAAAGRAWFADRPGSVTVEWLGYQIETSAFVGAGAIAAVVVLLILAWAVFDRISLKHRADPGGPPIPVGGRRNDIIAVVGGTILYLALGFLFHPLVIGVPAFGTRAL